MVSPRKSKAVSSSTGADKRRKVGRKANSAITDDIVHVSANSSSASPPKTKRSKLSSSSTPRKKKNADITRRNKRKREDDDVALDSSSSSSLNDESCLTTETSMLAKRLFIELSPSSLFGGNELKSIRDSYKNTQLMPTPLRRVPQPFGEIELTLDTRNAGDLLAVGLGDTGQLGLGKCVLQRKKPQLVCALSEPVVQACAGGMHSLVLDRLGDVYSWGCNDDHALGRVTSNDDEEHKPARIMLPQKAVQISAGDSHSAALLQNGTVYAWGTFRDTNGVIGLQRERVIECKPVHVDLGEHVVKIASGGDHVTMLTVSGRVYSFGGAEQGQLGRVGRQMSYNGGRTGMERLLEPAIVRCQSFKDIRRPKKFIDIWCGQYSTFMKEESTHRVLASGLNNYHQLGHPSPVCHYAPVPVSLDAEKEWTKLAAGMHHTIALSGDGKVYAFGRPEYGRLGLNDQGDEVVSQPRQVMALDNERIVDIGAGSAVSFAVSESGKVFSWGMGTNLQTGHGEDDIRVPTVIESKQIDMRKITSVSAGGQHTLFIGTMLATPESLTNETEPANAAKEVKEEKKKKEKEELVLN